MPPMQLQLKSQKEAEIIYLEANKQGRRYHLTYFTGFQVRTKVLFIF